MWVCAYFWMYLRLVHAVQLPPTDWDIRANMRSPQTESQGSRQSNGADQQTYAALEHAIRVQAESGGQDCLEGVRQCEQQSGICKVDLEILKQFCGDWLNERSLLGCNKHTVRECRSALQTVNDGRLGLRHCTCDAKPSRSIDDLSRCNLLRRNLNSHPCLQEPPLLLPEGMEAWQDFPLLEHNGLPSPKSRISPNAQNHFQNLASNVDYSQTVNHLPTSKESDVTTLLFPPNGRNQTTEGESLLTVPSKNHRKVAVNYRLNISKPKDDATHPIPVNLTQETITQGPEIEQSCLDLLEKCTSQLACAKSLNRYRALCSPRSCEKLRFQCNQAYKQFQSHGVTKNCTCDLETNPNRRQRCLDYEVRVLQNKCIDAQSVRSVDTNPMDMLQERAMLIDHNIHRSEFVPAQFASTTVSSETAERGDLNESVTQLLSQPINPPARLRHIESRVSCYDAYRNCVLNYNCLSHYVQLVRLCSVRNGCYLSSSCTENLRRFYEHIEPRIANQVFTCFCLPGDLDCKQQEDVFRPECSQTEPTQLQPCASVWQRCRDDVYCETALSFLINQCHPRSKVCQENSTACLHSYRQVWLQNLVTRCRCDVRNLNFYQKMTTVKESPTYRCDLFQRLLLHQPCLARFIWWHMTFDHFLWYTDEDEEDGKLSDRFSQSRELESLSRACRIANTLHLSPETIVRVYPKTEDTSQHSLESQTCSQLCGCTTGCLHHLCFPEQKQQHHGKQQKEFPKQRQGQQQQQHQSQQHQSQQMNGDSRRQSQDHIPKTDRKPNQPAALAAAAAVDTTTSVTTTPTHSTTTRITTLSACHYLPLADPQCTCLDDGDVHCSRNTNHAHLLKNFQLRINYARDEFSTILGLLDRTVSANEFQYYVRLLNLASSLETVLINATGEENCALLLARHHIPHRSADTIAHFSPGANPETTDSVEAGELTYLIVVVNRLSQPYIYEGQLIRRNADEICLQSLQLLELMINRRFPRIRYHPLLSVLKQASLVNRPISSVSVILNGSRHRLTKTELQSTPVIDQQAAWRKPRTSHKKRLEPISASSSHRIRRISDTIWPQSMLVLAIFVPNIFGCSV
ncbi:hypothetical protein D915_001103 [Fasciola hepatica]|uniref:GDNF/GAS1 domain protein n=1 Tax=Fasciola hepatica TaxID=6192 RepID=A0A4E0S2X6_FASHE|nr:hypothetical protein D915_001103 [Fasciola hepatica]